MMNQTLSQNQRRWNRKLMNGYWILFAVTIVLECCFFMVTKDDFEIFLTVYIIRPACIELTLLIGAELLLRQLRRYHDYVIILTAIGMSITLISVHTEVSYLLFLLFFPIIIATYYYQKRKVYFALATSLLSLIGIYTFHPVIQENISLVGLLTIATLIISYFFLTLGLMNRGTELLDMLRSSFESNQELLVKTVLMDKIVKTDALTELYNHITFHEYLEKLVEQSESNDFPISLAVIDIDNFKGINDTYGHHAGDIVLRRVADIIRSLISPNDFAARYGGEEFVIIFTEKVPEQVFALVESIRETIAVTPHEELDHQCVTVSVGLHEYVRGEGKEMLFKSADASLYFAKRSGKNKTVRTQQADEIYDVK